MEPVSDPFWDALEEGRFLLPACDTCNDMFFPPAPVCPQCHAETITWRESEGMGELYAFTRQHRTAPGIQSPIVLGVVECDDGPRLLARIAADYEALTIGDRVQLAACEYEGTVDRGRLVGFPFFEAQPVD